MSVKVCCLVFGQLAIIGGGLFFFTDIFAKDVLLALMMTAYFAFMPNSIIMLLWLSWCRHNLSKDR